MPHVAESGLEPQPGRPDARGRDRGFVAQIVIAIIAITALGVAGWALLRTNGSDSDSQPQYSDADRAAAKGRTCAAIDVVRRGVSRNTNLAIPGGDTDIAGALAVAANARVALYDGGQYLLIRLDPATPPELATATQEFADLLLNIGAAATAGALDSDPDQATRFQKADAVNTKLGELCA